MTTRLHSVIFNFSLLFGVISLLISRIDCEIFSAIEELEKLAANENILIDELAKFANQIEDEYVHRLVQS